MQEYNFGSIKDIKYFLKNYSVLLEVKQKGNRDAVELITDFESLLLKIKNPKIIRQYIQIESGEMEIDEKVKYFGKTPLEVISSLYRVSKEKVEELFLRELEEIVSLNGEEEFEYELPIYIYKETEKEKREKVTYSDVLQELKETDKVLRKKIKEEVDSKQKKHLINIKKENYQLILEQYEKENIDFRQYNKKSIKDNQVIYKDYVDNVAEEECCNNIGVFEQVRYIAKQVLEVEEYKIFILYYIINYTQSEIAEILNCKQQTISNQIKKINKKIKKMVNNQKSQISL